MTSSNHSLRACLAMIVAAFAVGAFDATAAAAEDKKPFPNLKEEQLARQLAQVRVALQERNPGTRIDSVQFAPIDGLYEVVMGKNVAYMDATGRYALFGNIWDMQARRDITADRKALLDRVDVAALDQAWSLRHVKGKGSRTVYVFADPQCGYCRQLEQTLAAMDDLTVVTFTLSILGPESKRLVNAITCAADPAAAWSAWMLKGEQPPSNSSRTCDLAPAEAVEALAKGLGITGTPTLVTADGRRKAGAMSAAQLTAWLAEPPLGAIKTAAGGGAVVTTASTPKTAPR
ncbi:MAG: hypothetical protein CFE45_01090 [Burkholderiales bacterium PBB5]|nr:MAG: hypothetical protein CFE45_01090 [Burkholderiales bacterium PBB5]